MLCRLIFTTVAISCVICVLLLSGLQKEDLDVKTLEKLQRYNVNIYDMNHELRQECGLKSYPETSAKNNLGTHDDDRNNTSVTPLHKENYIVDNFMAADIRKSDITAKNKYFSIESTSRNLANENNITDRKYVDIVEIKNKEDELIELKKNKVEYIEKQPSLESVISYWNKMSHKVTPNTVSEAPTTIYPTHRLQVNDPTTLNTENSEMEYFYRIIAEYLANQTAQTTTQATTAKPKNIDVLSEKFKEFLSKRIRGTNNSEKQHSTTAWPNIENSFGQNINMEEIIHKNDHPSQEALHVIYNPREVSSYDKKDQLERLQMMQYTNDTARTENQKQVQKNQALQYLDDILGISNQFNINMLNPYSGKYKQNNNENYENQNSLKLKNNNLKYNTEVRDINKQSDQVGIPANVIHLIAEKVKEIVLKDLRRELPTNYEPASPRITVTTATTAFPSIITSMKDKITSFHEEIKEKSQILQTLTEILKEFKTLKENANFATDAPLKLSNGNEVTIYNTSSVNMFPPRISGFDPYTLKKSISNIEQKDMTSYSHGLRAIPVGSVYKALQRNQHEAQINLYPKNEYKSPPITIQTNAAEIPPLIVQIPKPMKLINQHIIVTTQNPFEKAKEDQIQLEKKQELNKITQANIDEERYQRINNLPYDYLTKKLSISEKNNKAFINSYEERIQKLKDRIRNAHEHNQKKALFVMGPLQGSNHGVVKDHQVENNHHGLRLNDVFKVSQQVDTTNQNNKELNRLPDPKQEETFRLLNSLNRPMDYKYREGPKDTNYPEILIEPKDYNSDRIVKQPMDTNYKTINQTLGSQTLNNSEALNRLLDFKDNQLLDRQLYSDPHKPDLKHRDAMTNELLSQLLNSNYRDLIKILTESSPEKARNIPIHRYRENHNVNMHVRNGQNDHPTKFHEKLEQVENSSPDVYVSNNKPTQIVIAPRLQIPLSDTKQRTRFDDTNFKIFLKSQQKVTDMLEKILTAKNKSDFQSVETT